MVDRGDLDSKIKIGAPIDSTRYINVHDVPLRDRLVSMLIGNQITVGETKILGQTLTDSPLPEVLAQITLLTQEQLQTFEDALPNLAGEFANLDEQIARMSVSIELNQQGALLFAQNLRSRVKDLITTRDITYRSDWLSGEELARLADRWHLPVVIFASGSHFRLALREPELTPLGWRVLVYDPMNNGEVWHLLTGWSTDYSSPYPNLAYANINALGLEALRERTYDLSLIGDHELAGSVRSAKQARVQFNAIDCGPLCLYAAALRQGVRSGYNVFKFSGREQLERDTGLKVKTRQEILGR